MLRIGHITHQQHLETNAKIQERLRKFKSHIIKNIRGAKKGSMSGGVGSRPVTDRTSPSQTTGNKTSRAATEAYTDQRYLSKNSAILNKTVDHSKKPSTDYSFDRAYQSIFTKNTKAPLLNPKKTIEPIARSKSVMRPREEDLISVMGERKNITKNQFINEPIPIVDDKPYGQVVD